MESTTTSQKVSPRLSTPATGRLRRSTPDWPRFDSALRTDPAIVSNDAPSEFSHLAGLGTGRRIALLAVHHVEVGGVTYTGGAEKYIRTVLKALLASGAEVHVGYSGTSIYGDLLDRACPRTLTVERTNWLDESLSGDARLSWRVVRERRRWLRSCGADTVFIVQQAGGGAFGASIVAARSLGMRTVMSVRQQPEPLPRSNGVIPRLWQRRLAWRRKLPAHCCDSIIFNSARVADEYAFNYNWPARHFQVIPNGERASHLLRPYCGPPRNIAAVGRVSHAKGADTLLEAFALFAPDYPFTKLAYYGDGGFITHLRQKAEELNVPSRVSFQGYRRWRESIFPFIDICVQLSRRESMSNSILEAMAYGIPCVASNVGGMPELIEDGVTGILVPPDDSAAAASAIRRLLADPPLASAMGRASVLQVKHRFNLDAVMKRTVRAILGS